MSDTLVISRKFGDQDVVFTFKKLSAEHAAQMLARLKSRSTYLEAITRELKLESVIPIEHRDEMKYLALCDKQDSIVLEVAKAIKPMFDMIVTPDVKALEALLNVKENVPVMETVIKEYLETLFPTEAERKKS